MIGWDQSAHVLAAAVGALGGRVYGHTGDGSTDCSRAAFAILGSLYPRLDWESERPALMIFDASQPFSPIDAVVRLGAAKRVTDPEPSSWSLVQGWRKLDPLTGWVPNPSPSPNGHVFLWWEPPAVAVDLRGVVVEANTRRPWLRLLDWSEQVKPYRAGVEIAKLNPPR